VKVKVTRALCAGHGLCASLAPKVYVLDSDGYCASDGTIVPEALEGEAQTGANLCPEGAIELIEEPD
jgi:ferredoxin